MLRTQRSYMSIPCLSMLLLLSACDTFSKKEPLPGKREDYVRFEGHDIQIDTTLARQGAPVASAMTVSAFPQSISNFDVNHRPYQVNLSTLLKGDAAPRWTLSIGEGVDKSHRLYGHPVSDGTLLFTSDSRGKVTAIRVSSDPKVVWEFDPIPDDDRANAGCSTLAVRDGRVFVGSSIGNVVALDATSGKQIWNVSLTAPIRVMPAIKDGRVFVTLIDGKTLALDEKTGQTLWMYQGFVESSSIQGGAAPVVKDDVVVSSYSSGDIHVMKVDSDTPLWSDTITAALRSDSVSSLPHIVGNPILDGSMLYVISHGGRMVAFDLSQGIVVWQKDLGSVRSPLLIGQNIYIVDNSQRVVCLDKISGRVYWVRALPESSDKDVINLWTDPVAVNDQLVLASSSGDIVLLSLKDGAQTRCIKTSAGVSMMPIVINDHMYMVNDDGVLVAY